jgi:exportin-7
MVTRKYTNKRYTDELAGIADGAGVSKGALARLNIFPEFVKAACTVAGIWGVASYDSHVLHMRSLDWDAGNPMSNYPLITVYHPSEPGAHKHANIGYLGLIGVLTGMSETLSIG